MVRLDDDGRSLSTVENVEDYFNCWLREGIDLRIVFCDFMYFKNFGMKVTKKYFHAKEINCNKI